jgi:lambda family phage portal protein
MAGILSTIGRALGIGQPPINKYDAAGSGKRLAGWITPNSGPNRAIEGLPAIRNRARDVQRNDWTGAASTRILTTNLIGTGIIPRPKTADAALKKRLNELWDVWAREADADGILDFYGLQTLATRNWIVSGEIFIRLRARRVEDGLSVPLQIQILESDMVPMLDTDSAPGLPAGHRIRSGIELDRVGRRAAYWMYREHPGDKPIGAVNMTDLARVPADSVRHLYDPQRPGQMRGVSDFAPVLVKLRGVMDMDDAVLERQKLSNLFTFFVTSPSPALAATLRGQDPSAAPAPAAGPTYLMPGQGLDLAPGEDVKFSEPPGAGADYADFMRQQHLGVAAGNGTPYELMSGDLRDISDRTLRVVVNEFRRHCEQRQWQIIIPQFCQPVREAWANAAALSGALTVAESAEARRVTWQPQGWAYIHPVQDAQGKKIEVDAGFRSRSSVIGERGDDPDTVDAERAADLAREKANKLTPEPAPDKRQPDPAHAQEITAIRAGLDDLRARALQQPAAAPNVNVNIGETHVVTPPIQNTVNLPEMSPVFEATVNAAPAPNVHVQNIVETPDVNVTNEVQPAAIGQIEIISMPARETSTEITRDVANHITTTRQIEKDIAKDIDAE